MDTLLEYSKSKLLKKGKTVKIEKAKEIVIQAISEALENKDDINDVAKHFVEFGHSGGRNINSFDASKYISTYSDLQTAYGSDLSGATEHYVVFGFNEGRVFK